MFYVRIPRINGRYELMTLAITLEERGYGETVEYFEGGWIDNCVDAALPHLRFENEGDAIAYALLTGNTVSRTIPTRGIIQNAM